MKEDLIFARCHGKIEYNNELKINCFLHTQKRVKNLVQNLVTISYWSKKYHCPINLILVQKYYLGTKTHIGPQLLTFSRYF